MLFQQSYSEITIRMVSVRLTIRNQSAASIFYAVYKRYRKVAVFQIKLEFFSFFFNFRVEILQKVDILGAYRYKKEKIGRLHGKHVFDRRYVLK